MNSKNIEEIIPLAVNYLNSANNKLISPEGIVINKEYASYIKALGPSVRQAGLLKTIASYEKDHPDPNGKDKSTQRYLITDFIKSIMIKRKLFPEQNINNKLVTLLIEKSKSQSELDNLNYNRKILEIIAACKIAFALYAVPKE